MPNHKGLNIAISDEASSTVIHVRGPVSARMCDVGGVFDKLGVDLISCSTMPSSSSCDMTLVVVDRYESQPLDDTLKQSVTEGLHRVFTAHGLRSQQGSPTTTSTDSTTSNSGSVGAAEPSTSGQQQAGGAGGGGPAGEAGCQQAAAAAPSGGGDSQASSSGRFFPAVDACRADSASESIPVSKSSSIQLSLNGMPSLTRSLEQELSQQPSWHEAAGGISLPPLPVDLLQVPTAGTAGGPWSPAHMQVDLQVAAIAAAAAADAMRGSSPQPQQQQQQPSPSVRFRDPADFSSIEQTTNNPAAAAGPSVSALQRTSSSGRPPKPALKIDIPSDSDNSSSRWQVDSDNSNSKSSSRTAEQLRSSSAATAAAAAGRASSSGGRRGSMQGVVQQQERKQGGGLQAQDLARRLVELGMVHSTTGAGVASSSSDEEDDNEDDTMPSLSCLSGGSGSTAVAPGSCLNWQKVKSSGDLLLLANQQQMACVQRTSDTGLNAFDGREGQGLDCFGTSGSSLEVGAATDLQAGDSSRSLASVDQDQAGISGSSSSRPSGAVPPSPAARRASLSRDAAGSSSGRGRRPPPRTPSRIILSPVAVDGSGEAAGQPKLFISIPKSAGEERRGGSKRTGSSSGSQSVAATPRVVPFTPSSGIAMLTPASGSGRSGHTLKQLSSSLVGGRRTGSLSPKAAAAAAAAANMPYNVAVAAAQLLSGTSGSSNAREAAAAVAAAAAEKGDSSSPLPSPLHALAAANARRFSDDSTEPVSPRPHHRTSPGFQQPPPTPVHPAVAAAAAAAITAAAESAAHSHHHHHNNLHALLQLQSDDEEDRLHMMLPACMSPQRSSYAASGSRSSLDVSPAPAVSPEVSGGVVSSAAAGVSATTIPEGSEGDEDEEAADVRSGSEADGDGSSSEEWWCGELTGLSVRDIMTGPVKAVSADADMLAARQLMMQHNLPGLLVDAGPGQQPGFLTRGDFFKASMLRRKGSRKRGGGPQKPCVRDIMGPVLVVQAGMSIESCAQALQEAGVRHAAVREDSPAAATAAAAEGSAAAAASAAGEGGGVCSMPGFVGLVSDAAIYCCLGLYPDDAGAGEEELLEDGLLGLPHALRLHSGLDSSFDSSAGTETPLSSRSRVATPLLDTTTNSTRDGGGGGQQQHNQHHHPEQQQQQERQPSAASTDAITQSSAQQSRQESLLKLPDIVMLREGLGGQGGSSAASSLGADSVKSGTLTAPGAAAAAAAGNSRKIITAAGGGLSDDAATRASSLALAATGSDSSSVGVPPDAATAAVAAAAAAAAAGQVPDALARYKSAAALWEVDMSDLEMIKRIGEGSFGEVMLATYRGTKVAVKRLRVLDLDDVRAPNEQYGAAADGSGGDSSTQSSGGDGGRQAMGASQAAFRQFFEREIAILASIRHPNVVNFIGACHKPGQRCLVTEYCARGSLDQVLHKSGLALDLTKRLEFALDIARGMACLHAQRPIIIHRDLKSANLLVSARFEVKVADFGLSRIKDASHLQVSRAGLEGTIEYCAPEVLRGEPYTERCDIYSFGVVLWELLLRQRPYSDAEVPVFLLMVNIGNGTLTLPDVPVEAATPGLVELLNHCLAFSAADRPEFREVLHTLEVEYRALRAKQPPRSHAQQQQQQQQQALAQQQLQLQHAAAVLRCDSASSLAVNQQSPRITADSPDFVGTPNVQSPAGTLVGGTAASHVPPALTPASGSSYGSSRPASAAPGGNESDPYYASQQQQQQQMQQALTPPLWGPSSQQQPLQRHRLSQHDSTATCGLQPAPSGGGSPAPLSFGFQQGLQPAGEAVTPQLQHPPQHFSLQLQQQGQGQQVFSVPLPQLQLQPSQQQPQQVFVASACSSPRYQQPQQFAAVPVVPQLRVISAFAAPNIGQQQQQPYHHQQHQQQQQHYGSGGGNGNGNGSSGGGGGGGGGAGSGVKPPRHKAQLSRARSMPAPQSVNWDLVDAQEEEEEEEQEQDNRLQQFQHQQQGFDDGQEQEGGAASGGGAGGVAGADMFLFAEDSFVSNCSITAYSPCPSGQLCMLVEPASSTFGSSSAAGMMPYTQPQQPVLVTPNGQQVAVQQVPMQPVLIQQPGGQLQQAYIQQQPAYAALAPAPQPPQQQQQQQGASGRLLQQRAMGTPSPTPAVLGRSGTPLSSSPSPGINALAIMAAAGAAAAAARREGSASGAASPRGYAPAFNNNNNQHNNSNTAYAAYGAAGGAAAAASAGGSQWSQHARHSRSSSHGCSQEMPSLHLLQLSDYHSSRPSSPQRSAVTPVRSERHSSEGGGGGGAAMHSSFSSGTPPQYQQHSSHSMQQPLAPAAAVVVNTAGPAAVTPLLLQRLDSLHRSGSSGCSPRCLHRSSSPGLQSGEPSGQLIGLLVPGYCSGPASGPSSPRSHSPRGVSGHGQHVHAQPAAVAAVHHLHRPGSSRLAIQGSYELPPGAAAAATAGSSSCGGGAGGSDAHNQASAGSAGAGGGSAGGSGVASAVGSSSGGGGSGSCGFVEAAAGQALPVYNVVHAAPVYHHHQYPQAHPAVLQPTSRRAPSLLRIDSNSRDRAISPFAVASGSAPASSQQQQQHYYYSDHGSSAGGGAGAASAMGSAGSGWGAVAAAPAGTCSRTLSPFAAVSSGGSLDDVASRGNSHDVVQASAASARGLPPCAAGAAAGGAAAGASGATAAAALYAAGAAGGTAPAVGGQGAGRPSVPLPHYVSPFAAAAAAAARQDQDDGIGRVAEDEHDDNEEEGDTGAVVDTIERNSRPTSPAPGVAVKLGAAAGGVAAKVTADGSAAGATGGSAGPTPTRLASPFALMQQQQTGPQSE